MYMYEQSKNWSVEKCDASTSKFRKHQANVSMTNSKFKVINVTNCTH